MTKAYRAEGKSIALTGITTGISGGSIYRRSKTSSPKRYWVGVVTNDIQGTSETLETIDGRPILIGDGVAAEAQVGDGKGDMFIEGVFTLPCIAGNSFSDADPVYGSFSSNVASGVVADPSGAALSGALVGFAVGDSYTATTAPFTGKVVVDTKLISLPLHGLDSVAIIEV